LAQNAEIFSFNFGVFMLHKNMKLISKGKLCITTLLITCLALLAGCNSGDSKAGASANASPSTIKIADQEISTSTDAQVKIEVDQFLEAKKADVQKLAAIFSSYITDIQVDTLKTSEANGVQVPTLMKSGKSVHYDHTIPDALSAQSKDSVATLFVKSGNEFIRVSTSLKREDGGRAFGTSLSHKHPAYKLVLAGNSYTGTATLFGNIYMTEYTPILDAGGNLIGIRFVGIDITGDVFILKKKLSHIK
jgi:methyl-accepting chemotaxis protein